MSTNGYDMEGMALDAHDEDKELEAIKARVQEMEEEAEKLKQLQNEVDKQMMSGSPVTSPSSSAAATFQTLEQKVEADARSVYVGNVDYGATAEELEQHFHGCGGVNRVTILCDKFSGHPKGFAYIEFTEKDGVQTAMALDDSLFRGRQIKVMPKRTNTPGISSTNRGFRVARGATRGRSFGAVARGAGLHYGGYRGSFRGRGAGFRGMRRPYLYQPY